MSNRDIALARKPTGKIERFTVPTGLTIREMIQYVPNLPKAFDTHGVVIIDDVEYSRVTWDFVPEAKGTMFLGLRFGDDTLKSVLSVVAAIALTVATGFIGAGGAAAFLGAAFGTGTFGAAALAAGVGILGTLAIGALLGQRSSGILPSIDAGVAPGSASLSGNTLPPNGRLARCIGTRRVFPAVVSLPITEVIGDDEYIEVGYALCGPHSVTDLRSGDTFIGTTDDFLAEVRQGLPGDAPITLLDRQGFETAPGVTMSQHVWDQANPTRLKNQDDPGSCLPQWHRVTTRNEPDEFWTVLLWDEGLFDDDAATTERGMAVRIRFREVGSSTWINGPEIHFQNQRPQQLKKTVKFFWDGSEPSPLPTAPTTGGPTKVFVEVPVSNDSPGMGGWQSHAYFDAGAGLQNYQHVALYSDRVELYLSTGTFPKGRYEIEFMHSYPFTPSLLNGTTYAYNSSSIRDFFGYFTSGGIHQVITDMLGEHTSVVIMRTTSIWNETPFPKLGEDTLFAVKAKNRSVSDFSAICTSLVPVWDAGIEEWAGLEATDDPASQLHDVLTGPYTSEPIPADIIDNAALVAWADFCATNDLRVAAVAEQTSNQDAQTLCLSAGSGILRASDTWGVAWEYDRSAEVPVQIYTSRNSNNFQWSKAFDRLPDGIIATYTDELGERQQVTVYAAGVVVPQWLQEATYDFIDNETQATYQATLDLALLRSRNVRYTLDVDLEGLQHQKGDLIGIQHDSLSKHSGAARLVELVKDGNNITGLILDSEVPVVVDGQNFNGIPDLNDASDITEVGQKTGAAILLDGGDILVKELTGVTVATKELEFVTPFADPGTVVFGAIVAIGPLHTEYKRMIAFGITRKQDMQAQLLLVDEAPEIHT